MNTKPLERLVEGWRRDPESFCYDTFRSDPYGNPLKIEPYQIDILNALRDLERVAVMSGRGVGKTAGAALAVHWWLGTRKPALVVCSAGSWSHLTDKLWPEVLAWGNQWLLRDMFEYQERGIYANNWPRIWRVETSSSDDPNKVEGFHSPNLLLLIDEAKGMADEIYSALIASLSGQPEMGEQKALVLSTPPVADVGWYAKACESTRYVTIHVSGLDSGRVSKSFVEDIIETFGENSPEYKAYVLGVIPGGVTGQLLHKDWVEAAQKLGPNKNDTRRPIIVCDVAREGDDLAVIGCFEEGMFSLVKFEDRWGWWGTCSTTTLIERVALAIKMKKASMAVIDDTGVGGGVTDGLRALQALGALPPDPEGLEEALIMQACSIQPVNFGQEAKRKDRFERRKDELWWEGREALKVDEKQIAPRIALPTDKQIREWGTPKNSDFKKQLLSALYESTMAEKVRVFDKRVTGKEKTKTLPLKSPDLAHVFILGVAYYLRQEQMPANLEPPSTGEEAIRRMMAEAMRRITQRPATNPFARR